MDRINLLHLKTSANIGGAEVMLTYWPKYLSKEKFNQFVIFAEDGPLVKIIENLGLKVACFTDLKGVKGITLLPKLIRFIKNNKIDIIHAHGARVNMWGSMASILTGVPIIATEHGIDLWRHSNYLFNILDRFSAKVNKFRIGVSQAVCDMLKKIGVDQAKIICIENGIDVDRFNISVDISSKKRELGISERATVIGTVGRLVEQKGHRYLLEAAKMVVNKFPDAKFIIIGDGPLRGELEEQALNLGVKENIVFTGGREDIPELMAIMDIFVLPSITEGLPLVLLEAMVSKKPIIGTRVGGIPEVIEDGVTGLLVEPANSGGLANQIAILLMNAVDRKKMAIEACRMVRKKYNAKSMILKYEAVYERALSKTEN